MPAALSFLQRPSLLAVAILALVLPEIVRADDYAAHDYVAIADTLLGSGIDPMFGDLVANSVVEGAQQARKFKVIDRGRQAAVVTELEKQCSDMTAPECRVEMGQQLGAGYLLVPELRQLGGSYILTISWLDLQTGLSKATRNRPCKCEVAGLMDLARQLTLEVFGVSAAVTGVQSSTVSSTAAPPPVATGTLVVETKPPGAKVVVDGVPRGTTAPGQPVRVAGLTAGTHEISVPEATGHQGVKQKAMVAPGVEGSVLIELEQKPGQLSVYTTPVVGLISVDGRTLGDSPGPFAVEAGRHDLTVQARGYATDIRNIYVKAGHSTQFSVVLQKEIVPTGMVLIPAGEFWMGCSPGDSNCQADEKPGRKVYLDAYAIDRTEVTVDDYRKCVDAGGCSSSGVRETTIKTKEKSRYCNWRHAGRGDHPMNCVSYQQATNYCRWQDKQLPTEAQWEKAARGSEDKRVYPWGDATANCGRAAMDDASHTDGCDKDRTFPVGSRTRGASPYGVLDMAGNLWEWTSDWYSETYYRTGPERNPGGPKSGDERVMRGGSFTNSEKYVRLSNRDGKASHHRVRLLGFRCVK